MPKSKSTKPLFIKAAPFFLTLLLSLLLSVIRYLFFAFIDDPLQAFMIYFSSYLHPFFSWLRTFTRSRPFFAFDEPIFYSLPKTNAQVYQYDFPLINLCGTCTSCILQHVIITHRGSPSPTFFIHWLHSSAKPSKRCLYLRPLI
jgi:hypothetical protein